VQSLDGFDSQSQRADCSIAAILLRRRIRGLEHSPRLSVVASAEL